MPDTLTKLPPTHTDAQGLQTRPCSACDPGNPNTPVWRCPVACDLPQYRDGLLMANVVRNPVDRRWYVLYVDGLTADSGMLDGSSRTGYGCARAAHAVLQRLAAVRGFEEVRP